MSTRATIIVNGMRFYRHSDGYPECTLEDLKAQLKMHRYANDPELYATDLVHSGDYMCAESEHGDEEFKYEVDVYEKTIKTYSRQPDDSWKLKDEWKKDAPDKNMEDAIAIFKECFSLEKEDNELSPNEIDGKLHRYCLDKVAFVCRCFDENKTTKEILTIIDQLEKLLEEKGFTRHEIGDKVFWSVP